MKVRSCKDVFYRISTSASGTSVCVTSLLLTPPPLSLVAVREKLLLSKPKNLARTVWALAETNQDASELLAEIESREAVRQNIADNAKLSDIVNILVAFSKNRPRHIAPEMLSKLEEKGAKGRRNNSSGPISYFDKMVLRATPLEVRAK